MGDFGGSSKSLCKKNVLLQLLNFPWSKVINVFMVKIVVSNLADCEGYSGYDDSSPNFNPNHNKDRAVKWLGRNGKFFYSRIF